MKTVCIDVFSSLPVPAVKGGAVETLYNILLDENEKYKKLNLVIISPYDKEAEKESKKYKNSRIVYVKKNDKCKRVYNKLTHIINRILKKNKLYEYDYAVENRYINKVKADYYITTGNGSHYKPIVERYGMDKVIFHIHTEVKATEESDEIFKRTIGVSKYVSETYYKTSKWDSLNGKYVLNCTDEDFFKKEITQKEKDDLKSKLGFDTDDFIVIYAGRIIKDKGIDILLTALEKIENQKIKVMICGGVNSAQVVTDQYLNEIVEKVNNSKGRVIFTGYIEHSELYKYFGIANILVVPSMCEEAAGLVLIEGMYCGLPIIMTDSGGMSEYADDSCSIVIERNDDLISNLSKEITFLYNNEERRIKMSKNAHDIAKRFNKFKFYSDFVNCFDEW